MTVIEATAVMIARSEPGLLEASKSASPTPTRLATLARIRMRSAVGREASSIAACRAVASPSMPPTLT